MKSKGGNEQEFRNEIHTRAAFRALVKLPIYLPTSATVCFCVQADVCVRNFRHNGGPEHPLRLPSLARARYIRQP